MNNSNWYTSKWAVVSYHVLAWLAWFFFPYLVQANIAQHRFIPTPEMMAQFSKISGRPFHRPPNEQAFMRLSFIQNLLLCGIFYLNAYKLIPTLLYRRKIGRYVLILFSMLAVLSFAVYKAHEYIVKDHMPFIGPRLSFSLFFLFIVAVSTTYRIVTDKIESDRLQKEKENANLQTELSFLRSQISPHFVFNVLNNMVSLARKNSDQLETSLIRLSGLMRYMLYEANADKVLLSKEIEYLKSYIDLQQQRFAGQLEVTCYINCDNDRLFIEPMLLIPFVENAFKHGTGLISQPKIDISLQEQNGILLLEVENNFNNSSGEIKDKSSGIGLANVKRRLDLLYGSRHQLLIKCDGDKFLVQLQLNLT